MSQDLAQGSKRMSEWLTVSKQKPTEAKVVHYLNFSAKLWAHQTRKHISNNWKELTIQQIKFCRAGVSGAANGPRGPYATTTKLI